MEELETEVPKENEEKQEAASEENQALQLELDELVNLSDSHGNGTIDTSVDNASVDAQLQPVTLPGGNGDTGQSADSGQSGKSTEDPLAKLQMDLESERAERKKISEQVENLNRGISTFRKREKELLSEVEALKSGKEETAIDPEVRETIRKVINEETQAKTREQVEQLYNESESAAIAKHGEEVYGEMFDRWFIPAVNKDPELKASWKRANDPAEFVMDHGKKLKEAYLKPHVESAEAKTKEQIFKELKSNKLPVSLSSIPGAAPSRTNASEFAKEVDELLSV